MKKRLLSLLLILVMTLSLLPTAVLADEPETDYGITIVSPDATTQIDVTSKNYKDVMLDGTVSYDPETKVLTLNDANLGCIRASQIQKPLTLRLVGDNTITTPQGIYSNALTMDSLSIEGNGRLHVKAQLYAANSIPAAGQKSKSFRKFKNCKNASWQRAVLCVYYSTRVYLKTFGRIWS